MRTWIKICATTCIEDAQAAIAAGADALGFVFVPSKRRISAEQAAAIIAQLPATIERVGVFNNDSAARIREVVEHAGLTAVQLHGEESPEFIAQLMSGWTRAPRMRVIKTVLVNHDFPQRFAQVCDRNDCIDCILLDAGAGSGMTFDWSKAQPQLGRSQKPIIVAGGLNAENVGEAIRQFSPWGVDVASGVERKPGRKDPDKLMAFVAAVRKAEKK
ncbi:MAG TPA: phosphoribosylanthranilate isomerase [Candidatus Angelobacter sp.]